MKVHFFKVSSSPLLTPLEVNGAVLCLGEEGTKHIGEVERA